MGGVWDCSLCMFITYEIEEALHGMLVVDSQGTFFAAVVLTYLAVSHAGSAYQLIAAAPPLALLSAFSTHPLLAHCAASPTAPIAQSPLAIGTGG